MRAKIKSFLEFIKFEHTIFALPFAYMGMVLAANGLPTLSDFLLITLAMASARTLAMAVNRIVDRQFDAENPRTAARPLVNGKLSLRTAWTGVVVAAVILIASAALLGPLTLVLLPGAVIFLLGYSFTKRFTWLSHFILGFTDGLAPMGAWVAVRQSIFSTTDLPAWILLAIVTFWIGGFDIMYACQDTDFDRTAGLHSIPARYGNRIALTISAVCHIITVALLFVLGSVMLPHPAWWGAVIISAGLLAWEHVLVKPDDLSKMDAAFFNINSIISITLLTGILATVLG